MSKNLNTGELLKAELTLFLMFNAVVISIVYSAI